MLISPLPAAPIALPTELQLPSMALIATRHTQLQPRWLEQSGNGMGVGWSLPGAASLDDAVAAARTLLIASASLDTTDDSVRQDIQRMATPMALLQAKDGAWFASRLAYDPQRHDAIEHIYTTMWSAATPAKTTVMDATHYDIREAAPIVRAVVSENAWWRPTGLTSTMQRFGAPA
ncbi:MAG: hypothetical protein JWM90_633 [Thermoleophilia bacterium]|nr:hypothetical protein [Thermoleophilia bacterium]